MGVEIADDFTGGSFMGPPRAPSEEEWKAAIEANRAGGMTGNDDRPSVDVRNDALAADWLLEELGKGKLAGIFRRGDMLVRPHGSASTATSRRRILGSSTLVQPRSGRSRPSASSR